MLRKWVLAIQGADGKVRKIPLDHEYETEDEASREAEDIADREYKENDEGWGVEQVLKIGERISEEHEKARFKLRVMEIMMYRLGNGRYDEISDFDVQAFSVACELRKIEGG